MNAIRKAERISPVLKKVAKMHSRRSPSTLETSVSDAISHVERINRPEFAIASRLRGSCVRGKIDEFFVCELLVATYTRQLILAIVGDEVS